MRMIACVPPVSGGTLRVLGHRMRRYRQTWRGTVVIGVADPLLSYAGFAAPALLATAAMNGAMNEATFNMYARLRVLKTYDSVLAAPLQAGDVALGEVLRALLLAPAVPGGRRAAPRPVSEGAGRRSNRGRRVRWRARRAGPPRCGPRRDASAG